MTTDERFEALDTKVSKLTESLETSVRRQRITITALILVAMAAAVMAAAPQSRDATFDKITAKRLWIVNDAGKLQASLAVNEEGGVLNIRSAAEKVQASLRAGEDGGGLYILNAAGDIQARLGTDEDGGILSFHNAAGKSQVLLATDETGGFLRIYNTEGELVGQNP